MRRIRGEEKEKYQTSWWISEWRGLASGWVVANCMSEASMREGGRANGVPKQKKLTGLPSLLRPYNGEKLSGKPGSIGLLDRKYHTGLEP